MMAWLMLLIIAFCVLLFWSALRRSAELSRFYSLVVVIVKNLYRSLSRNDADAEQRDWQKYLLFLGATGLFVLMLNISKGIVQLGLVFGQPELVYVLAILAASLILFLWGMGQLLSVLYFSRDSRLLLSLPIAGGKIVGAKLVATLLGQYGVAVIVFLPVLLTYAGQVQVGVAHWLVGILVLLLLPVLPLLCGLLVLLPVARLLTHRARDWFAGLGSILGVMIYIIFRLMDVEKLGLAFEAMLAGWQVHGYDLVIGLGRYFPPSIWATRALAQAGSWAGMGFLFLLLSTVFVAAIAVYAFSSWVFLDSIIGSDEAARKRWQRTGHSVSRDERHLLSTLFWREWKLLLQTPVFILDALTSVAMPLFLLVVSFRQEALQVMCEVFAANSQKDTALTALVVAGLMALMTFYNRVASAGISREGQCFYISKMIPVSYSLQIRSKQLLAFLVVTLPALFLLVTSSILLKPSLISLVFGFLLGSLANWFIISLTLSYDLGDPVLDWTDPKRALKGMVKVAARLIVMVVLSLSVALIYVLKTRYTELAPWTLPIVLFIYATLAIYQDHVLVRRAAHLYDKIEL